MCRDAIPPINPFSGLAISAGHCCRQLSFLKRTKHNPFTTTNTHTHTHTHTHLLLEQLGLQQTKSSNGRLFRCPPSSNDFFIAWCASTWCGKSAWCGQNSTWCGKSAWSCCVSTWRGKSAWCGQNAFWCLKVCVCGGGFVGGWWGVSVCVYTHTHTHTHRYRYIYIK